MTSKTSSNNMLAGLLEILVAVLIWGATPFITRSAALEIPAVELTAIRLLGAGLLFGALIGPSRLLDAARRGAWLLVLLAFAGSALPQIFYIYAVKVVPIPTLVFITNSYPVLAIFMAVLILKEKPSRRHWVGIGLALVGIYLLASPSVGLEGGMAVGLLFALLASIGWASSAIMGKKVTEKLSAGEIVATRNLAGGALSLPLLLLEPPTARPISLGGWAAVAVLILMLVVSFYVYYLGLAQVSVSTASFLESFTPVVTLAMSALFFGEILSGGELVGACFVLAGTLLVSVGEISQAVSAPTPPK